MLVVGCWVLVVGCWLLVVGCWVLGAGIHLTLLYLGQLGVFLVLPSLVVADLGISSSVAVWNFGFVS